MIDTSRLIEEYDKYVLLHGDDSTPLAATRADIIADLVEDQRDERLADRVTDEELAGMLFDHVIRPVRKSRRAAFLDDCEWLLDILEGNSALGEADPVLDRAYMLGNGSDKALRFWTADDWRQAITVREDKGEEMVKKARVFKERVGDRMIDRINSAGVITTGELFHSMHAEARG